MTDFRGVLARGVAVTVTAGLWACAGGGGENSMQIATLGGGTQGASSTSQGTSAGESGTAPIDCGDVSDCFDADLCTDDRCEGGTCRYDAVAVDDGDACTLDSCDPAAGVLHTAIDPDDGDACTADSCDSAAGVANVMVDPDDGNACTTDACDPAIGVTNTPVDPNDGDACTTDTCDPATGIENTAISCVDGNPCTDDGCDPGSGCTFVDNTLACNDGDACTSGDVCGGGTCAGTPSGGIDDLQLTELNVGTFDYVALTNTGSCTVGLGGLTLLFDDSSLTDLTFPLPSMNIAAGATLVVFEPGGVGDIPTGGNIFFTSGRGGAVLLCDGSCAFGANVIDVVAFSTGAPHPPLPTPVTFAPAGLTGISSGTENTTSWIRIAIVGAAPNFLAADWTTGPASQ